ncbi:MAG: PssD/Cps14F family polysaccharide biosynthesis glycosyltransferase [Myxococcota bacterium]
MKLCLIASSGGHIFELFCLKEFWQDKTRVWVSFPTQDAKHMLRDEETVHWAAYPTVRNVPNLVRNLALAPRILMKERPDLIVTTGSGVAAPFIWWAKLLGIKTVFVESITRITEISLTGRMVYPFVDTFLVQWEELVEKYPKAQFQGRIV